MKQKFYKWNDHIFKPYLLYLVKFLKVLKIHNNKIIFPVDSFFFYHFAWIDSLLWVDAIVFSEKNENGVGSPIFGLDSPLVEFWLMSRAFLNLEGLGVFTGVSSLPVMECV